MLEDSVIQAILKGLQFNIKIDKRVPKDFYSDPEKIINVLFNLISNSIKYTYLGWILVRVQVKDY